MTVSRFNTVTTASGNRVHMPKNNVRTLCGVEWSDDQRSDLIADCERCLRIQRSSLRLDRTITRP